ncbi:MAG: isoaspartyl peptidase/L-asparaginase [Chloroflexi bacterium]|nr:isoaspartyl peptidase/L-asparaginase [Chloroflexota bacterium]
MCRVRGLRPVGGEAAHARPRRTRLGVGQRHVGRNACRCPRTGRERERLPVHLPVEDRARPAVRVEHHQHRHAADHVVDDRLRVERTTGTGGLIVVDAQGRVGHAFNTPRMACAWVTADGTIESSI